MLTYHGHPRCTNVKGKNTIFAVSLKHLVESGGALGILNPK